MLERLGAARGVEGAACGARAEGAVGWAMAVSRIRATISRCAPGGRFGRLVPPGKLGGRLGGARNCAPDCAAAYWIANKITKINALRRIADVLNDFSDLDKLIMKYTQKYC